MLLQESGLIKEVMSWIRQSRRGGEKHPCKTGRTSACGIKVSRLGVQIATVFVTVWSHCTDIPWEEILKAESEAQASKHRPSSRTR
jgi:hypothetical protein